MRAEPFIKALIELSGYFDKPLYIVGGAIRNYHMGLKITDIDLAAAISPQEVIERLKDSPFKASLTSKKLFTLKIEHKDKYFEFTSFRKDTYTGGKHTPDQSSLTDDILIDAKRRDFTVNAVYYDILKDEFVDPLGGIDDLNNRIIRTVDLPERVFSQDGLRLMRLARQAAEMGLDIDKTVMDAAKENVYLIKDIAIERIRDEFDRIITADRKYNIPNAHIRGLKLLEKIGLLSYILPELEKGKGLSQRKDYHKYDVYTHILKCFEYSQAEIRLAALLHDIAKPFCVQNDGSMKGHDREGKRMAENILNRLKYPKRTISEVKKLVYLHMYDLKTNTKDSTIRRFIQENFDILDKLIALKQADHKAGGIMGEESPSAARLKEVFEKMKAEGIPFTSKDLKVDGKDLIELDIPAHKRSLALKSLLNAAIYGKDLLTREGQLKYLSRNKKSF